MNYPQKRTKAKKAKRAKLTTTTLRDKLKIWAWFAGFVLVLLAGFHLATTRNQRLGIDKLMERWRHDYHLTDEQARRIRAIEEGFHGSGNPFTRPTHSPAETREHHREIAAQMNPEEGARFFRAQEGIDLNAQKPNSAELPHKR